MNDINVTPENIISTRDLIIAKEIIAYAAESFILWEYQRIVNSNPTAVKDDFKEAMLLITLSVFDKAKEDNVDTSGCSSFLAIVMEVRNYVMSVVRNYLSTHEENKAFL